ncbi:MAG: ferredoxin [Mycobacterium sp.]|jgi:ferredoxin|nr:ferredoxin [Mycobacterium sp.]
MKVSVIADRCIGAGECTFAAPDVFDLDDGARVVLLQADPPEGLRRDVLIAARRCPAQVIAVDDDGI